ncbi:complement component C8 gamma chain isoform X5 [Physeter macrocephalus]|uniref:Complement component C8 gamma chain n=1 Tax=Physeter macrocephalus TaxID=9755 RepID=A0A455B3Q7_PHYMC|nr:complement component C8 gamma chain isoform X5 [Physeter catodon]|eukprot:XP_028342708.1 complement component C8 gamma chain isoform X2 [Physeter catodon]
MLTPRTASLLTLLLAVGSLGQRAQRPPRPPSPISTVQPKANFDAQQFSGTWFLVAVASSCRSLQEQGHRAEATTLHVTPQGAAMAVSTFRKLDGICWQVRQLYRDTGLPGRFLLQARGARGAVDVVVGETDYRGFAILYLERARQLSVKLYARSLPVSESFLSVFEQRVQGANLTEDHTLFFPKYGFCEAADQFHVLDGERAAPAGRCGRGLAARGSLLVESRLCCRSEEVRPAAALHREAAKALEEAAPATPLAEWGTLSRPPPKPHLTPRSSGRCLH